MANNYTKICLERQGKRPHYTDQKAAMAKRPQKVFPATKLQPPNVLLIACGIDMKFLTKAKPTTTV